MSPAKSGPGFPKVPVGQLRGRQLRGEFSTSLIKRLRKSMRENGYDDDFPIVMAEVDGRKIIIDGHHRARAAGASGIAEVPVRIIPITPEQGKLLVEQAAEAAESLGLPF